MSACSRLAAAGVSSITVRRTAAVEVAEAVGWQHRDGLVVLTGAL